MSKLVSYPTLSSSMNKQLSEVTRSRSGQKESPFMIESER